MRLTQIIVAGCLVMLVAAGAPESTCDCQSQPVSSVFIYPQGAITARVHALGQAGAGCGGTSEGQDWDISDVDVVPLDCDGGTAHAYGEDDADHSMTDKYCGSTSASSSAVVSARGSATRDAIIASMSSNIGLAASMNWECENWCCSAFVSATAKGPGPWQDPIDVRIPFELCYETRLEVDARLSTGPCTDSAFGSWSISYADGNTIQSGEGTGTWVFTLEPGHYTFHAEYEFWIVEKLEPECGSASAHCSTGGGYNVKLARYEPD